MNTRGAAGHSRPRRLSTDDLPMRAHGLERQVCAARGLAPMESTWEQFELRELNSGGAS